MMRFEILDIRFPRYQEEPGNTDPEEEPPNCEKCCKI